MMGARGLGKRGSGKRCGAVSEGSRSEAGGAGGKSQYFRRIPDGERRDAGHRNHRR